MDLRVALVRSKVLVGEVLRHDSRGLSRRGASEKGGVHTAGSACGSWQSGVRVALFI
jgi:hypothetical protein